MPKLASRPRRLSAEERRRAILKAAAEVFFESGYEGTSIDAIIERVGGSKRAIYTSFGNKEGLFAAIVRENADAALEAFAPQQLQGHDLRTSLLDFARRLVAMMMEPTTLAIYRMVVAEGARFPALARRFYADGPGRAAARLVEVLNEYTARDGLQLPDPQRAADHFIGMLRDNRHLEAILGLRPPADEQERESLVRTAVDIFLDGVRTRR